MTDHIQFDVKGFHCQILQEGSPVDIELQSGARLEASDTDVVQITDFGDKVMLTLVVRRVSVGKAPEG